MNNKQTGKSYNAFTLTEILIALTIIGIVAVLTVPNLANDTSSKAYQTKFKATFAQIQDALIYGANVQKHRFVDVGNPDATDPKDAKYSLKKYMDHHFNASKINRTITPADENSETYKLKNGTHIIFPEATLTIMEDTGCDNSHSCIAYIDVNGKKGPNEEVMCTDGKTTGNTETQGSCTVNEEVTSDIYQIIFKSDHIYPATNAVEFALSK